MSALDSTFAKAYGKSRTSSRSGQANGPRRSMSPSSERVEMTIAPVFEPETETETETNQVEPAASEIAKTAPSLPAVNTQTIEEPLHAAYEAERFAWPETALALLDAARSEWRELADDLAAGAKRGRKTILVLSTERGAGCSTVTIALAKLLAESSLSVALVDGDFSRPALGDQLGIAAPNGWDDALRGVDSLSEAMIESAADHLSLAPLREAIQDLGAFEFEPVLSRSLQTLRENFDLVFIDGGPLPRVAGQLVADPWHGGAIDAAILVQDARRADDVDSAEAALAAAGVTRVSVVRNFNELS